MPPHGKEAKSGEPQDQQQLQRRGGGAAAAAVSEPSAIRSMETTHKSKITIRCKVVIVGDAHARICHHVFYLCVRSIYSVVCTSTLRT